VDSASKFCFPSCSLEAFLIEGQILKRNKGRKKRCEERRIEGEKNKRDREERREGGREGGTEGGREGGKEGGRQAGRQAGRKRGRWLLR
jgi:hypothetical protein